MTPYWTGSDDSVVRTSGPDEPVADEHIYNVVSTSTPDESVSGLMPYWTGSDDSVVRTSGPDERLPM